MTELKSNVLVSIVVVTGGRGDFIYPCLNSIKAQGHEPIEITVIDNSLNQDFNQGIAKSYPDINLYPSPKNLFYCQALNKGITHSKGDFILCLNDDVVLDKKFIEEALRGFWVDRKIGMVSGKILRSGHKTIDSTGLFLSFWRTAKERGYGIKDSGQYEKEEYIFGVNGAAAFYRRQMLEEICIKSSGSNVEFGFEYFDPDFHIFYEDLDIAWRAQNYGWKGYYIPSALAYHIRGATVREPRGINKKYARMYLNERLHFDLIKNRYLAIIKNERVCSLFLHILAVLAYDIVIWIFILVFRPQLIKTFLLNLGYFKSAFKKRKIISQSSYKMLDKNNIL